MSGGEARDFYEAKNIHAGDIPAEKHNK